MCACVRVSRVAEPTPWVSAVGLSRDEQSRIKSILILARQEPLLLLGDTSTEREEKREQTLLLLLLLLSSLLSHSFAASSSPHFFIPSPRLRLSFSSLLLFFFFFLAALAFAGPPPHPTPSNPKPATPPSPPPVYLSTVAAPHFLSSLPLGLCTTVRRCWHSGTADGPFVKFKAVWRFSLGSRGFVMKAWKRAGHLWGAGVGPTAQLRDDDSLLNVKNVIFRQSANLQWYQITYVNSLSIYARF